MKTQYNNFINFISSSVFGIPCDLCDPDYEKIVHLAQCHGVLNMLGDAIAKLPISLRPEESILKYLKKAAFSAAVRSNIQGEELEVLKDIFRNNGIAAILLKGAVLKDLYLQSEHRHMSDIDILIGQGQGELINRILCNLGWTCLRFDNGSTDIYISDSGMKYEIHRDVSDEGFNEPTVVFLENLVTHAECRTAGFANLPYEEHYAYILCHFVKHLLNGGIGVRQVMDIYLCRKKWEFDEEKLNRLLAELELTEFAATIERLANHWFGNGEGDSVTEELGEYILGSGVFGKEEQKVADRMLKEEKKQSKLSYVWSRLFPSYKTMCFYYPVLKKWSILLPVFWVWRMIYALIFRRDKLKREVTTVSETDREAVRQRAAFYQRCGLNVYSEYAEKS